MRYVILFSDGTTEYVTAYDREEAYVIASEKFNKKVFDIWLDFLQ